jgi:hypothetical protein
MYLRGSHHYYRGTEQCVTRAPFLLLLQLRDGSCGADNTYAVVRKVALRQLGHWMMGRANLGGRWYSVSGTYGHDGLPMTVDALPKDAKPLPRELYEAWSKGGGWNGAGSEASAMRAWALVNFMSD